MSRSTFLIIGANLAGGSAAATLREQGFDGNIVLIGAEPHPPYERPPLSKHYLRGEQPFEKSLVRPADFYESNEIETRLGRTAERLIPSEKKVVLDGGEEIQYDIVLIATGGRNRRLPVPGFELEGVMDLRTVADADRIREEAKPGRKSVSVGMGFIGSEVAASLRQMEVEVTAIELFKVPLERVLGEEVGRVVADYHADHGVEMIFEDEVESFEGRGRVERVVTKKGRKIECDFALVAIGIEPAVDIVAGTGVSVENGILVDEYCRTNVDGIYAAGDVANHYHPVFRRHLRVEHWQNALRQGAAAARSMMGKKEPYEEIHWFWSDQYDYNLQYAGFHTEWDNFVVRGSMEERNFVGFYMKADRIQAAVALNRGRDVRRAMKLIETETPVEASRLRDEDIDIRKLAE